MSENNDFPLLPDYSSSYLLEENVLRSRLESARTMVRQKAAPRRVFNLVFTRRGEDDWTSLAEFHRSMLTDFFNYEDHHTARSFSVEFSGPPEFEEAGNQQINMRCQFIEKIGAALSSYPSIAGGDAFVNLDAGDPADYAELGSEGKQFVYAGFGYRVNGSLDGGYQIYLDGTVTDGNQLNESVPLGLHRLRVKGGGAGLTGVDYLI